MLLVGDIGGTKARLALISAEQGPASPLRRETLASRDFPGAAELVSAFLGPAPPRLDGVVLAVAGPVVQGRAELSNLSWLIEETRLRDTLGVPRVRLLNDLLAMANAIPLLDAQGLRTLQAGTTERGGAIAVVAPGTGLGEASLTWDGTRYRAHASEAGHADFAPTDPLQMSLLAWMQQRHDRVSYERVCSGRAMPHLYEYLRERGVAPESTDVGARLVAALDRTPVIVDAAFDERAACPLSRATVDLFSMILMAEAGNAALRSLATGGVYLGGGLPRRVLGSLTTDAALARFRRKGRLSPFVARVPLHVIVQPDAALLGAASWALSETGA
jgi:glucokinase